MPLHILHGKAKDPSKIYDVNAHFRFWYAGGFKHTVARATPAPNFFLGIPANGLSAFPCLAQVEVGAQYYLIQILLL
jgi:hypothetical protein